MLVEAKKEKKITIEAKTYCKLGHFNLLQEDFPKGNFKHCNAFGVVLPVNQFASLFSKE